VLGRAQRPYARIWKAAAFPLPGFRRDPEALSSYNRAVCQSPRRPQDEYEEGVSHRQVHRKGDGDRESEEHHYRPSSGASDVYIVPAIVSNFPKTSHQGTDCEQKTAPRSYEANAAAA